MKSFFFSASINTINGVTRWTKKIKFAATAASRAMDAANGGVLKHGGFHRLYGGHSLVDLRLWKRFGVKYPLELLKDSLTPNGLPVPGIETLAQKKLTSIVTLQKWGSLNIGQYSAGILAIFDTYKLARRDCEPGLNEAIRATTKLIIPNPISTLAGLLDFGIIVDRKIKHSVSIDGISGHFVSFPQGGI